MKLVWTLLVVVVSELNSDPLLLMINIPMNELVLLIFDMDLMKLNCLFVLDLNVEL